MTTTPYTIDIHGHTIELEEPDEGIVTDVLILSRVVCFNEDGQAQDYLMVNGARTTTGMIIDGMLTSAVGQSEDARISAMWGDDEEDDS